MDHIGIDPEQFVAPMAEALAVVLQDTTWRLFGEKSQENLEAFA